MHVFQDLTHFGQGQLGRMFHVGCEDCVQHRVNTPQVPQHARPQALQTNNSVQTHVNDDMNGATAENASVREQKC